MGYSKISDKQCNQAGYAGKQNATIDGAGADERGTMAGGQGRGLDRRPCPHSSRQLPQRGHVDVSTRGLMTVIEEMQAKVDTPNVMHKIPPEGRVLTTR